MNCIRAFLFTCDEMKACGFGQQFSVAPSKAYRIQPNTPYSTRINKNIDNDQWRSFVLSFRKLVLNNDLANLNRVLNILSKYGSKKDQQRIRKIKAELKMAGQFLGYGASIGVEWEGEMKMVIPKDAFDTMINGSMFHNDPSRQEDMRFIRNAGIFSLGAMLHYVIFTYKQALRIESSIKLRCIA